MGDAGIFNSQWPRFMLRLSQSVADANLPRWTKTDEPALEDEASELWRRYVEALPQLQDVANYTMSAFINASFAPNVQLRVDSATLERQWPSVWTAFFQTLLRRAKTDQSYWSLYGRQKAQCAQDAPRRALRRLLKFVVVVHDNSEGDATHAVGAMNDDDVPMFREVDIEAEPAYLSSVQEAAVHPGAQAVQHQQQAHNTHVQPVEPQPVKAGAATLHSGASVDWSKLKRA
nr:hypothetical protein WG33_0056 [uncultured bacterium]